MNCKYWWFLLPQDIITNFTQADDSRIAEFEDFNDLVSNITWWTLPQKLQFLADFVEYNHTFTWFRLPEQVEAFCEFVSELTSTSLTPFNVSSTTGDHCVNPDLSPYNQVFYHTGVNVYPVLGDFVYSDSEGVTPVTSNNYQMADLNYLSVSGLGEVVNLSSCF